MRYSNAPIVALAGLELTNALPFSIPSFSLPTRFSSGSGGLSSLFSGGSGLNIPSLPAATDTPSFGGGSGSGLSDLLSGGSGFGTGSGSLLSGGGSGLGNGLGSQTGEEVVQVTATPTGSSGAVSTPTAPAGGSTGGSGTSNSNCTPQGNGGTRGTENGIENGNCCTDMTVVFARGTGEFGNVGTVSGPPMFAALRQKLGANRVTVQGVDYPASAAVSLPVPAYSSKTNHRYRAT